MGFGGSHLVSYAYFLRALHRTVRGKPQQPEAGNENSQGGKIEEQLSEPLFTAILFVEIFVQEKIAEGSAGDQRLPFVLDSRDGSRQVGGRYLDGNKLTAVRLYAHGQGLDLLL